MTAIAFVNVLSAGIIRFAAHREAANLLTGLTFGIAVAAVIRMAANRRRAHPPHTKTAEFAFLRYAARHSSLLASGALINLGVWAGYFIDSTCSAECMTAVSIVPAVALYAAFAEKQIYAKYGEVYGTVANGGTLAMIERAKARLSGTLARRMLSILGIQVFITALVVTAGGHWLDQTNCSSIIAPVSALGSTIAAMTLLCILNLLYVEDRKGAFAAAALFCAGHLLPAAGLLPLFSGYNGTILLLLQLPAFVWSVNRLPAFISRLEKQLLCSRSFVSSNGRLP
jgi:uncharacterized membrane protein